MNAIRRFWNSSLAVTALMGCLSLVLLVSLCGILNTVRRPAASIPAQTATPPTIPPTWTASPTATATDISSTSTPWILPTNTLPPTRKVDSTPTWTITPTLSAMDTPPSTPLPEQAAPVISCVPGNPLVAEVLDVIDGDTIKVLLDGLVVKVKYIGIDAPESVSRLEYLGKEAKARNRELVSGRNVLLFKDVSESDRFDRLLRYVFVEDRFINYELITLGYASAQDEPPDSSCAILFAQAAAGARDKSLGIWAPHTPLPEQSMAAGSLVIFSVNEEAEFVDIQNVGETEIDLNGWKLVSELGKEDCRLEGTIQPSEILRVFSGPNQPGFSCGFEKPIWDDKEPDPAVLYDPDGNEVDRYP